MKLWVRIGLAIVLIALLFGTFVHYDVAEEQHDPYPENDALVTDYDAHVGEQTLLFGTVQSVDGERMVIEVNSDAGPFEMIVEDPAKTAEPGGVVQVYGTLQPEQTISPDRIEVVNEDGGSNTYKYGVSAVGALLVAILFVRYWTIDTDAWALEVRDDG